MTTTHDKILAYILKVTRKESVLKSPIDLNDKEAKIVLAAKAANLTPLMTELFSSVVGFNIKDYLPPAVAVINYSVGVAVKIIAVTQGINYALNDVVVIATTLGQAIKPDGKIGNVLYNSNVRLATPEEIYNISTIQLQTLEKSIIFLTE